MRIVPLIAAILFFSATAFAAEIREFSLPTLERLGNELAHRDEIAARAADLVLERFPAWKKITPQWWITILHKDGDAVYLIDASKSEPALAYKVLFPGSGSPGITDVHGQLFPPETALRYKALQAGMKAARPKLNSAYGARYNFEVVNDPDGSGFLVYALAAFTVKDPIHTGGHVRITVSGDGAKVKRIDQLSHGIIEQKADRGTEMVAVSTAQAVDTKYPVEAWLYTSHLYHLPMYVAANNGSIWACVNGRIVRVDDKGPKNHLDIINGKAPNKHDPGGRY